MSGRRPPLPIIDADEATLSRMKEIDDLSRVERGLLQQMVETEVGDFMSRRRLVVELHDLREVIRAARAK